MPFATQSTIESVLPALLIAIAVIATIAGIWRLDRRMKRHGITADPVTGSGYVGQTNVPKINSGTGNSGL